MAASFRKNTAWGSEVKFQSEEITDLPELYFLCVKPDVLRVMMEGSTSGQEGRKWQVNRIHEKGVKLYTIAKATTVVGFC